MIRKNAQFEQAVQLRKRGFTYNEIAKIVDVSKSTVSLWLSRETWSQTVRDDNRKRAARENSKRISLLNKARNNQHKKLYSEAERSAVTEYRHYKHNPLFVAGLMLYAGHGDAQRSRSIRISTSKIEVHRIFIMFATEYLGVSRGNIRFWLLLSPDHIPERCAQKWSKGTRLPLTRFHKHQISGNRPQKTLHFGIGNTIIGSAVLKRKLLKWLELLLKDL